MMVTLDIIDYQFLSNLLFTTFQMQKKCELETDFSTLRRKYQKANWREMLNTLDITDYQFLSNLLFTTFSYEILS